MTYKPLIQGFADNVKQETVEMKHKGKVVKFNIISREWNDEKVGFNLILQTVAAKNWRHPAKDYPAFQNATGNGEINFI